MADINYLIQEKIKSYPQAVQKLLERAIELAKSTHETAVSEQLEGELRDLTRDI